MKNGTRLRPPYNLFMTLEAACGHSGNTFSKGGTTPHI